MQRSASRGSLARSGSRRSSSVSDLGEEVLNYRLQREEARIGSITASLLWSDPSDLDLHAFVEKDGGGTEHISYKKKIGATGKLDVDMNAGMQVSTEPVENIFWEEPAPGKYVIRVHNYKQRPSGSESMNRKVPFRVFLKVDNRNPSFFEGAVGPHQTAECFRFEVNAAGKVSMGAVDSHAVVNASSLLRSLNTLEVLRTVQKRLVANAKLTAMKPMKAAPPAMKAMKAMKAVKAMKAMKAAAAPAAMKAVKVKLSRAAANARGTLAAAKKTALRTAAVRKKLLKRPSAAVAAAAEATRFIKGRKRLSRSPSGLHWHRASTGQLG